MAWRALDLAMLFMAAYGAAWIVTKSKLAKPVREQLSDVAFFGALVRCIVCVSVWIAGAISFALDDYIARVVYVCAQVTFSWVLALLTGDAE